MRVIVRILLCVGLCCGVGFTKSPKGQKNQLELVMVGDALLHKTVYEDAANNAKRKSKQAQDSNETSSIPTFDFYPMLEYVKPLLDGNHLRFYNQETILGGIGLGLSTYPAFNSPQEFGDEMLSLGFNVVSLANNHTLDKGERGVLAMLEYWRAKESKDSKLLTSGSYESLQARENPRIMESNGITYTMLAYTYGTNGIPLPKGKEYLVNVYTKEMMQRDIAKVRELVDFLIVSIHWGIEYQFTPNAEQKELAKFLAQNGVDLVIGNHPHAIQPIDIIDNTLVLYSLGNFISGQRGLQRQIGALVGVTVRKKPQSKTTSQDDFANPKKFIPKVQLGNLRADLIYTHSTQSKGFKLYPFVLLEKLEHKEKILPNFTKVKQEYRNILSKNGVKIQFYE